MYNMIIKDLITEENMKKCLQFFFKDMNLSVEPFTLDKKTELPDISFEYIPISGDFKFVLWLYTDVTFSGENISVSICKTFDTQVLISDDDVNPYSWILITKQGVMGTVYQIPRDDDVFLIEEFHEK